ncbi:MAG: TIGR00282 family metallophosphoesterase [Alphaproteobacteria bacterium]|nr:TIGR00282 family metallophosphoesterase [Alphaproteobacteria bacterium]
MNILFLGDIYGRSGRDAVKKYLPHLKEKLKPDVIIANVENAAHGFGVTPTIAKELFSYGIDVMTTGNHVWDQKDIIPYSNNEPRFLRPLNYPKGTPGQGAVRIRTKTQEDILVINVMGRVFMDPLDDPFYCVKNILETHTLKTQNLGAIFIDIHAETTSEKYAMAHYVDGKVTAVVGTHTHIPTADAQILSGGTAIQADAGMCGDYNSVIGVKHTIPVERFVKKMPTDKFSPAEGLATLCGTYIETNPETGLAQHIRPIRIGPRLIESL